MSDPYARINYLSPAHPASAFADPVNEQSNIVLLVCDANWAGDDVRNEDTGEWDWDDSGYFSASEPPVGYDDGVEPPPDDVMFPEQVMETYPCCRHCIVFRTIASWKRHEELLPHTVSCHHPSCSSNEPQRRAL